MSEQMTSVDCILLFTLNTTHVKVSALHSRCTALKYRKYPVWNPAERFIPRSRRNSHFIVVPHAGAV